MGAQPLFSLILQKPLEATEETGKRTK